MTEPLDNYFETILGYYREQYEVRRPAEIASTELAALAEHHSRENKSLLGFSTKRLGPQANEYILFVDEPRFDTDVAQRLKELAVAAERELVRADADHAFTFLSVIALCGAVDESALKALRRMKHRRDYRGAGWMVARFVVIAEGGTITANGDGSDLKNLLRRILKESQ